MSLKQSFTKFLGNFKPVSTIDPTTTPTPTPTPTPQTPAASTTTETTKNNSFSTSSPKFTTTKSSPAPPPSPAIPSQMPIVAVSEAASEAAAKPAEEVGSGGIGNNVLIAQNEYGGLLDFNNDLSVISEGNESISSTNIANNRRSYGAKSLSPSFTSSSVGSSFERNTTTLTRSSSRKAPTSSASPAPSSAGGDADLLLNSSEATSKAATNLVVQMPNDSIADKKLKETTINSTPKLISDESKQQQPQNGDNVMVKSTSTQQMSNSSGCSIGVDNNNNNNNNNNRSSPPPPKRQIQRQLNMTDFKLEGWLNYSQSYRDYLSNLDDDDPQSSSLKQTELQPLQKSESSIGSMASAQQPSQKAEKSQEDATEDENDYLVRLQLKLQQEQKQREYFSIREKINNNSNEKRIVEEKNDDLSATAATCVVDELDYQINRLEIIEINKEFNCYANSFHKKEHFNFIGKYDYSRPTAAAIMKPTAQKTLSELSTTTTPDHQQQQIKTDVMSSISAVSITPSSTMSASAEEGAAFSDQESLEYGNLGSSLLDEKSKLFQLSVRIESKNFLECILRTRNGNLIHDVQIAADQSSGETAPAATVTDGALNISKILGSIDPNIRVKEIKPIIHPSASEMIVNYDKELLKSTFTFGLVYQKPGQTTEKEIFNNTSHSDEFEEFINFIGRRVALKNFNGFRGGLDKSNNYTGEYSVYEEFENNEIMFHVSTLLPHSPKDQQQLERKRHIGNDRVCIVFQDEYTPFTPQMIKSKLLHVFIVVQPIRLQNGTKCYQLSVISKNDVPDIEPSIRKPFIFKKDDNLKRFLLTKLVNAEYASLKAKAFIKFKIETIDYSLKKLYDELKNMTAQFVGDDFVPSGGNQEKQFLNSLLMMTNNSNNGNSNENLSSLNTIFSRYSSNQQLLLIKHLQQLYTRQHLQSSSGEFTDLVTSFNEQVQQQQQNTNGTNQQQQQQPPNQQQQPQQQQQSQQQLNSRIKHQFKRFADLFTAANHLKTASSNSIQTLNNSSILSQSLNETLTNNPPTAGLNTTTASSNISNLLTAENSSNIYINTSPNPVVPSSSSEAITAGQQQQQQETPLAAADVNNNNIYTSSGAYDAASIINRFKMKSAKTQMPQKVESGAASTPSPPGNSHQQKKTFREYVKKYMNTPSTSSSSNTIIISDPQRPDAKIYLETNGKFEFKQQQPTNSPKTTPKHQDSKEKINNKSGGSGQSKSGGGFRISLRKKNAAVDLNQSSSHNASSSPSSSSRGSNRISFVALRKNPKYSSSMCSSPDLPNSPSDTALINNDHDSMNVLNKSQQLLLLDTSNLSSNQSSSESPISTFNSSTAAAAAAAPNTTKTAAAAATSTSLSFSSASSPVSQSATKFQQKFKTKMDKKLAFKKFSFSFNEKELENNSGGSDSAANSGEKSSTPQLKNSKLVF